MAQPLEVRAFRKRLKSAGYSDIEILRLGELDSVGDRLYLVRAREPLSGLDVSVRLCASDMGRAFQPRPRGAAGCACQQAKKTFVQRAKRIRRLGGRHRNA